ncbi:MAG: hypothetical protein WC809_01965 [Sinimarinibacterium sp.]
MDPLTPLSAAQRDRIFRHAAGLFIAGLVMGLIFTFEALGHVAAWPLVPAIDFDFPGTEQAWRRTHLGAVINALAMLLFALAGTHLQLGERGRRSFVWAVVITGWGNTLGFLVGTLFGARGLAFGGGAANSLSYLLFLAAAFSAFVQGGLLWSGARQGRR